jgi:hypothetical protein
MTHFPNDAWMDPHAQHNNVGRFLLAFLLCQPPIHGPGAAFLTTEGGYPFHDIDSAPL